MDEATRSPAVSPDDVVVPSQAVAEATNRLLHRLTGVRLSLGAEAAQIEAMAMHNAGVAFLRPVIGPGGIQSMKEVEEAQGRRCGARDDDIAVIGAKRAARLAARRMRSA